MDRILLSCGNGGKENAMMIDDIFMKYFREFAPFYMEDSGLFHIDKNSVEFAMSVDSYTISPIFFPGGDIGKISVCGSCNDVAVMGAKPKYITISFIIEEGFLISELHKIAQSIANEIRLANLSLLSADTKVVPKGALNGIFITTNVVGEVHYKGLSAKNLQNGDVIILSAPIGAHGACIYCLRNNIKMDHSLQSDCANMWEMINSLICENIKIRAMRDATRGGIASLLNEWANASKHKICINESEILILDEVRGICEILGIEPYSLANEGVCAFAIPKNDAMKALKILHQTKLGKNARIIGEVCNVDNDTNAAVILRSALGINRYLEYPEGEILPRIC